MSRNPTISVVIPSYNHAAYIGETIESLLSQTFSDFELIIVDDGSTDNSPAIIKGYASIDSRIIPIFQANKGPSAAVNRGLKIARGRFITGHTSDDRSHLKRLEVLSNYLNEHHDCDFVGSYIEEIDDGGNVVLHDHRFEYWFNVEKDFSDPRTWVWENRVASPALMFRREFFDRYGSYDPDLIYTQDWEILIRSISMGAKLQILPNSLYQYRSHANNLTNRNEYDGICEYAYISSKRLIPWLLSKNLQNEIFSNVYGFILHSKLDLLSDFERQNLMFLLTGSFKKSYPEFKRVLAKPICDGLNQTLNFIQRGQKSDVVSAELFLSMLFRLTEQCRNLEVSNAEQAKVIDEQANMVAVQAKTITAQAKVIDEIYTSIWWRLTRPIRFFKQLIHKFCC